MIYAFASGEYTFADSTDIELWSDRDGTPVSARDYAYSPFSFEEDIEHTRENILDELNHYFRFTGWHAGSDGAAYGDETDSVWPFIVLHKISLVRKFYGPNGWTEEDYPVPTEVSELMKPLMDPKVFQDCD